MSSRQSDAGEEGWAASGQNRPPSRQSMAHTHEMTGWARVVPCHRAQQAGHLGCPLSVCSRALLDPERCPKLQRSVSPWQHVAGPWGPPAGGWAAHMGVLCRL